MGNGEVDTMLISDDDEFEGRSSRSDYSCNEEGNDEFGETDSGAGSNDVDISELGEPGEELCQVAFQSCSVPYELYDLEDFSDIFSMETWNNCLNEEDRLSLADYLPDMEEETYKVTMKELFEGQNFHFGSPVTKLFDMLKGGLCEPRVQIYQQGLNFFQQCKYYYTLQQYQNSMVNRLVKARGTLAKCKGSSTKEKINFLNLKRSRQDMMSDSESDDWSLKKYKYGPKSAGSTHVVSRERAIPLRGKYEIQFPERVLKLAESEFSSTKKASGYFSSMISRGLETKPTGYASRYVKGNTFDFMSPVLKKTRYLDKFSQPSFKGQITSGNMSLNSTGGSRPLSYPKEQNMVFPMDNSVKEHIVGEESFGAKRKMVREPGTYYDLSRKADPLEGCRASVKSVSEFRKENTILKGKAIDPGYIQKYPSGTSRNSVPCFADFSLNPLQNGNAHKDKIARNHPLTPSSYKSSYSAVQDINARRTPKLMGSRAKIANAGVFGHPNVRKMNLTRCTSAIGKQKGKADTEYIDVSDESDYYLNSSPRKQVGRSSSFKASAENKSEFKSGSLPNMGGLMDVTLETGPVEKPFVLITPTVHYDFSFSIIHFLSAVRIATLTPIENETANVKPPTVLSDTNKDASTPEIISQKTPSALTIQEIINRVKLNPGDPCILETQEPLKDLVRGALKIFSAKTASLGVKGWKSLVSYNISSKGWSWIGPVPSVSSDPEKVEEILSSEAWGLPHKMLVKLVDAFANWLKYSQETLRQLGNLPPPPLALMQLNIDNAERFKDSRAQRSLATIGVSCEEVRSYFRKEELLRYLLPDRAFSYTATDGRKSSVAPLRRCGGKVTTKAREHFMLKVDRPGHVTILCLVRDAAARLPGSIGTRADVCNLIRDSQYLVEEISDAQINQVCSGALDRLHYERDPCVKYDSARKLWAYLHRDREEEDFHDDGTSSTKKWKRPKKDPAEQTEDVTDQGTDGTQELRTGGLSAHFSGVPCDLNSEPSSRAGGDGKERCEPPSISPGEITMLEPPSLLRERVELGPLSMPHRERTEFRPPYMSRGEIAELEPLSTPQEQIMELEPQSMPGRQITQLETPSKPPRERTELIPPSMPQGEMNEFQSNIPGSNIQDTSAHFEPMSWGPINLDLLGEDKMPRRENSSIEDFGDKTFVRDRPVELFRTGVS